MMAWLNIGSLVLGAIAWILPVLNLLKYENPSRNWMTFSFVSLSACSISILFQIISFSGWIRAEDWAALMDTIGALTTVSTILLIGTIILNGITLYIYRARTT